MPLVTSRRPKPKPRQTWALRTTTPSPWRLCSVVSRAQSSLPRTLNWEEGEVFQFLLSLWYHFDPGGKKLLDRPKPFSHVHLRRAVEPDSGSGSLRGPRRGDSALSVVSRQLSVVGGAGGIVGPGVRV